MTPQEKHGDAPDSTRDTGSTGAYLALGSTLAGTLLLTVGGGYLLDKKFGTAPVLFLVGAGVGLLAAAYHIYKMYVLMTRKR